MKRISLEQRFYEVFNQPNVTLADLNETPIVRVVRSGVETVGDTWVQFKVQYYIYGLIFLVFDVEIVLMFPWALAYKQLDFFGFFAGLVFIFFLFDALTQNQPFVARAGLTKQIVLIDRPAD